MFSDISSRYFQYNFSAHSLCHVTHIIYFNKCSDPDVKLAVYDSFLH